MHAGQPDSAPSAAQGDILLLSHYAEPNPAVAAEPALTRRPTVFQRPSEHLQLQQHATGERDFRTRDERSLSRVLQLVSGGESSTEVTTVLQTNVNLPGTNATAMTSNDNYETHDSTVTDTQANVDGNYAMLDDDHARYETSSFVRKRQSDAQYSQVLPNSQPYLRPRGLLMANNEYASPLPHGPSGGPYPTLKSGGNSFAVPYALAMDADVDAGDAGQYYLTPSSAPQPDSGHPLGWVADNSLEGSPDSACQDHRPAGTSGSRLGRRHVHHGCTACHKKQNTCPGWCCFRRRLVLFVGCVLFAGTIAGGVLGLSYRKESTENEGSDKAQAVGTSTVTTSMAPATTELSSVVKVIRLEAVSASVCVGGGPRGIGYFRVYLNGTDQDATQGRGTNIVIFDSVFNVIFRGTYDTFLSTAAADALGNKLDSYPNGTVAVIGMVDEHSNAMNKKVCGDENIMGDKL